MTDKKFQQALIAAEKIVESWPAWKQNSLLVTNMATSPTPRKPVEASSSHDSVEDLQSPNKSE